MFVRFLFIILISSSVALSHELKPSVANISFEKKQNFYSAELIIQTNLESLIAEIEEGVQDTNDSENSEYYNSLRKKDIQSVKQEFKNKIPNFAENIFLGDGTKQYQFNIIDIRIDPMPDLNVSRQTFLTLKAENIESDVLNFGWKREYGPIIIRVLTTQLEEGHAQLITPGLKSSTFSIVNKTNDTLWENIFNYVIIGFEHIVPKGLDHILFVIGLFLFSPKFKPLIIQISAFTLAHTITIFLGVLEIVQIPAEIVEPIIALSISYVAIENIFFKKVSIWRPIVIFSFGLLHGLGFAGVISEIGLPQTSFIISLISFNVGVEFGQLAIILICFASVYWIKNKNWYKKYFTNPLSIFIAIIGLYWFVERVL